MVIFVITEPKRGPARTPFGIVSEYARDSKRQANQDFLVCPTLLIEPLALHPLDILEVLDGVPDLERGAQPLQELLHHHLILVHAGRGEAAEVLQNELFPAMSIDIGKQSLTN